MDESTIRGLKSLELKDSEAAIRKSRICVEGYDISLPVDEVKSALRKHFSSCGDITRIFIPRYEADTLNRYAHIVFLGEDAVDKALKLHGSDVGGWHVLVRARPFPRDSTPEMAAKMAESNLLFFCFWRLVSVRCVLVMSDNIAIIKLLYRMTVSGYDPSLPEDDVKSVLIKHFSWCGEIAQVLNRTSKAHVYIRGEKDATEKAQKLSGGCGCDVEGCKIVVDKVMPQHNPKRLQERNGFSVLDWLNKKAKMTTE